MALADFADEPGIAQILNSQLSADNAALAVNQVLEQAGRTERTAATSVKRWRRRAGRPGYAGNAAEPCTPSGPVIGEDASDYRERYRELQARHDSTLRQLAKAKARTEDLVDAVYRAAGEAAAALDLPAAPKSPPDKRRRPEEVAVAVLSDWQLAKLTPTYNSEVCERRIERFANEVLSITDIQRADHPVRTCHVWALGDLIEGELIFPGQSFMIDASLYRQVCVDGPRILGNFLRKMLRKFDTVEFHGVIGNHGAIGGRERRNMNPESNGDRMLYRITQQLLEGEDRITWDIPDGHGERHWYTVATIGAYSSLLIHGDQLRGYGGMPWYGLQKKVGGWRMGAIPEHFQDVYFGHYHQPTRVTLSSVTARCAGSTESFNQYAMEQLAAVGYPSQPLMFVHPERGIVTAEYCCWLDLPDKGAAKW